MKAALITGASGGIGYELAILFAQANYNLVLVARNEQALQTHCKMFAERYNISSNYIACDLSKPESIDLIVQKLETDNTHVDVLVNNAGFGDYGEFCDAEESKLTQMMQLNMISLTRLTYHIAKGMKDRKYGIIMNIASLAAFMPCPYLAVYAASKSYVLHFSEAIGAELKPFGIKVSTVCPGPTETKFQETANMQSAKFFTMGIMPAKKVAAYAFKKGMKGKSVAIPGIQNKIGAFFPRLIPRFLLVSFAKHLMSKK